MTIVELTAVEIYSLHVTAMIVVGLSALAWREYQRADNNKERGMIALGLFILLGLPVIVALRVLT